ncbi:MAG TPA: glycosyltransferase [Anaerolineales bacterium]|nr:glycosyltransferase [Anaerolineales bacterium]
MKAEARFAFVIDALPALGGAEKVLFTALEAYPQADVFTLIYNKRLFNGTALADRDIQTSYLNKFPLAQKHHRFFLPLMPRAVESFDLRDYDVIVSFSYAVAHGVRNHNGARHYSYTYTPMRYAWTDLNLNGTHARKTWFLHQLMGAFRKWDRKAASRVHSFAAISCAVARRIQQAWGRDSRLIYPPVEIERFKPGPKRGDYYITVSRLVPHKRVDLLVQAFSQLGLPLLVIGDGPQLPRLKDKAKSNVQLPGYQPDSRTAELIAGARGFVCAAEEDFGIAIVEAQAAGTPVLAYRQGGALESVIDGQTGLFFEHQSLDSLIDAVERFEARVDSFCTDDIVKNARRFCKSRFLQEFSQFIENGCVKT